MGWWSGVGLWYTVDALDGVGDWGGLEYGGEVV